MTDPPNRTPLSTAAEGVMAAVALRMEGGWISPEFMPYEARKAAAALRAAVAATQMRQYGDCWICDADKLLAIAANLENAL